MGNPPTVWKDYPRRANHRRALKRLQGETLHDEVQRSLFEDDRLAYRGVGNTPMKSLKEITEQKTLPTFLPKIVGRSW